MTSHSVLRSSLLALVVLVSSAPAAIPLLGGAAATTGCGQSVATCATICAFPDAPISQTYCESMCTAQQECGGADSQALLTCVANAGTYSAMTGVCAPQAAVISHDCAVENESSEASATSEDDCFDGCVGSSSLESYDSSYESYDSSYDSYDSSYDTYDSSYDSYDSSYDSESDSFESTDTYDSSDDSFSSGDDTSSEGSDGASCDYNNGTETCYYSDGSSEVCVIAPGGSESCN